MQNIAERLRDAGTTALSDALDRFGIAGQAIGILPVARSMRFAGRAFTIRMLPVGTSGGSVGDYIDDVAAGDVVVIDNDGNMGATVWGDILTWVASERGIAGTVIDGVCRDSDRCVELGYPVFARANTMRTGKDRVTADAYNVAVQIAGVRVSPGDWIVGDSDGVVVIPAKKVEKIVQVAEEIEKVEAMIRQKVSQGLTLAQARKDLGYHSLQTKR
ncbi:MAG: RraA family protein [Sphingomonas sp.]|uniref:RraA family protein n=1 Tax=Sphingomonas sp. TaxID=28214 RepID=UPI001AC05E8D|nr:RraA family protein [Sphingomonas sp.]MBN8816504.1 RraA family protein [Sphingomonas sp.]